LPGRTENTPRAPSSHAVRKYAEEVIAPKVYEMDESEVMDKDVIQGLFDNGVSFSAGARDLA
jgi:hypothetical protein